MEDYYIKYAKPLDELSLEELRMKLLEWQEWTKEELELIIFISNGVKNESMNKLSQSSKSKTVGLLDQLKSKCINQMEILNEFASEIESDFFDEIDTQLYSKVESLRETYNNLVLTNQKTIINSEILIDLKEKFYKMKKVLNEANEGIDIKSSRCNVARSVYYGKEKCETNTPGMEQNPGRESTFRDNINSNMVYKKYSSSKRKVAKNKIEKIQSENDYPYDNAPNPNDISIKNRNASQTSVISKHFKDGNIDHNNYDNRSNQIIQIKTEMMILKEDMKRLFNMKNDTKEKMNEELISKLSDQNYQMKNDIFDLRKQVDDLRGVISSINKKMTDIMDENQSVRRHNQSLINYISSTNKYKGDISHSDIIQNNKQQQPFIHQNSKHHINPYQKDLLNQNNGGESLSELSKEYISDVNDGEISQ